MMSYKILILCLLVTAVYSQDVTTATTEAEKQANQSCTTRDGSAGECVAYYLCSSLDTTVEDEDDSLLDIPSIYEDACESYIDICCKKPNTTPVQLPQREGCGWRNPEGVGLVIKTVAGLASYGEFPWVVAIIKTKPNAENKYLGSGSLIHPNAVLTAAHTIKEASEDDVTIVVRAGEWDTQNEKEIYPYQERNVTSHVVHKDYNKGNLAYDVAVLFLSKPMDLAPNVGVACLPPPRQRVPDGTRCYVTGWGKDKFGKEGLFQVIMNKAEISVVNRDACLTALRSTKLGVNFQLHTSFMCGSEVEDRCKGDGGAPLVCPIELEKDRYMQSGINAWGIGCDTTPGVYVDVSIVRDWIDDKIAGKGYDPKTYTY